MSYTRRQFVVKAFGKIGLASYAYDLTPDQLQDASEELDAMMAEWNGKGIRLGYPIPGNPEDTDLDAETGVPDSANAAIYMNLGMRIAPNFGKIVPIEVKVAALGTYNMLLGRSVQPGQAQVRVMPAGAGNKHSNNTGSPFTSPLSDLLTAGPDSELDFSS